jgi:photosystem II stability/assembly factor-like uncharacterized protein
MRSVIDFFVSPLTKELLITGYILFYPIFNLDVFAQWEIHESGVRANLRDVCFVDRLHGWAVGDSSTIIATVDGGKTWIRMIEPDDSVEFRHVQFLNREIGFVGGNKIQKLSTYSARRVIVLLRTTNGGLNWETCDFTFAPDFRYQTMQFLDSDNGWVGINNFYQASVASQGILLKTTDGGKSWSFLQEINSLWIGAVAFFNTEQGYSFWAPFYDNYDDTDVYATQDGGKTWTRAGRIELQTVVQAKCLSPDMLWARGWNLSRSQDGGKTWKTWRWSNPVIGGQKRFFAGDFEVLNSNNVWLVGNAQYTGADVEGVLLRTSNAGEDWWPELQVPNLSFGALSVVSEEEAWIAGRNGLIIHLKNDVTGLGEEAEAFPRTFEVNQNYPNPFNASTWIEYFLPTSSDVRLEVFDILGSRVRTLVQSNQEAGKHKVIWNGENDASEPMASGVYVYRMTANGLIGSKKMILIR